MVPGEGRPIIDPPPPEDVRRQLPEEMLPKIDLGRPVVSPAPVPIPPHLDNTILSIEG